MTTIYDTLQDFEYFKIFIQKDVYSKGAEIQMHSSDYPEFRVHNLKQLV